ncbi:hypothetical protein C8Q80DRAFT_734027 [Daedaleopsis nitida]|nr:hypothetical protein C8Q80DRAFT_734027 [Daedaleopsis nitida]
MILCSPCCSPQFVHAAQLLIHSLQAEVQELYDDAAATAHICGECKKSMKKSKRTPVNKEPPPGTEEQQEQLKLAGREYALLVRPWASRPAMAITQRPTIDPEDPITRFASPMSQRLAIAAEIHTFLPKHMLDLLCEPWGVPMFSYAVGQRKGHMLEKIKPNRAAIFSHIPDIDINLEYWRGTSQQFPPSFFPPGQHGVMPKVFCQPSFVKILLICNYGAGALVENHVPRTNCSAILWAVDEVTPGMLAFAACVLRFLLSGESIFKQSWEKHFDFYLRFLLWMRLNQSDVYKRLIAWLDESVYPQSTTTEAEDFDKNAPLAPKPGEISSTPFDAMDEAWNKLDWSIPGVQEKLPDVQNRPVEYVTALFIQSGNVLSRAAPTDVQLEEFTSISAVRPPRASSSVPSLLPVASPVTGYHYVDRLARSQLPEAPSDVSDSSASEHSDMDVAQDVSSGPDVAPNVAQDRFLAPDITRNIVRTISLGADDAHAVFPAPNVVPVAEVARNVAQNISLGADAAHAVFPAPNVMPVAEVAREVAQDVADVAPVADLARDVAPVTRTRATRSTTTDKAPGSSTAPAETLVPAAAGKTLRTRGQKKAVSDEGGLGPAELEANELEDASRPSRSQRGGRARGRARGRAKAV